MGGQCFSARSTSVCQSGTTINLDPVSRTFNPFSAFGGGGEGCGTSGGGGGGYSGGQGCETSNGLPQVQPVGGGGGGGSFDANNPTAIQYMTWDSALFGQQPDTFANGYMNLHGIVAVGTILSCPEGTYDSISNGCVSCFCDAGFYSVGCGGTSRGDCRGCENTEFIATP